ncbi:unnamed protein product, partial [Mesorhabditis belari]|uniref:EndoU domain-containing protein n=1 Tax=Mesorhabditis belari TaxID=2138241 RepID=A0AAF3ECH6_9BILA
MTSPEAEFLAYTICALAGAGKPCPATIQGTNVYLNVTTRNGADGLIDEAYPTVNATSTTTTTTKVPNTQPADDADLQAVVDSMRAADTDRALDSDYTLDWGNKVSGTKDVSPNPLFKQLNEDVFNRPIYQKQIYIYDQQYFHADTCIQEPGMSGFRKAAVMDWLNTVYNTTIFQQAYRYLLKKGKCTDQNDLQTKLFMLWFGTYNRCTSNKSILGSSGWEHVFCGEWKENTVDGHHSWVNYYRQEKAGQINYYGYYSYEKQLTGTFQYQWSKAFKKTGGFLIGTSPAFDFSLLSICVLTHPNSANCKFTLDGFHLGVTSYTEACDAGTCISTAYPTD